MNTSSCTDLLELKLQVSHIRPTNSRYKVPGWNLTSLVDNKPTL